jgi:hypothetical protein
LFLHDLDQQPLVVRVATALVNCWWLCSSSGSNSGIPDMAWGLLFMQL